MASIKDVAQSVAQHDQPQAVEILNAQGEPYKALDGTPATITVVGVESDRMRRFEAEMRARIRKGDIPTEDDQYLESVVTAVVDWHGWDDGTNALPCTPANVRALLGAPEARHIYRQVERAINRHAGFFGASSGS